MCGNVDADDDNDNDNKNDDNNNKSSQKHLRHGIQLKRSANASTRFKTILAQWIVIDKDYTYSVIRGNLHTDQRRKVLLCKICAHCSEIGYVMNIQPDCLLR